MCGRFINISEKNKIKKIFNVDNVKSYSSKSYNISPQQNINVLLFDKGVLTLDSIKWGYNFYNKLTNKNQIVINSRIETINSKILFKESFLKRKCIVLANGYFEWKKINNLKFPYFINLPEAETIYFAAIWRLEKINNLNVSVCCIITKEANKRIKDIHSRMPLIFSSNEAIKYLHDNDNQFCKNLNESEIENDLDFYEISKEVNNPINNYKKNLNPIN